VLFVGTFICVALFVYILILGYIAADAQSGGDAAGALGLAGSIHPERDRNYSLFHFERTAADNVRGLRDIYKWNVCVLSRVRRVDKPGVPVVPWTCGRPAGRIVHAAA
jgi:hypothetical protein